MALTVSAAIRPHHQETECGDQAAWWDTPDRLVVALADGLGHGADAALAARVAIQTVARHAHDTCCEIFEACNEALRHTRGVALTVAIIDSHSSNMQLASVGNIRNRLLTRQRSLHFGSARGIVGAGYHRLTPETVNLQAGDWLVLFSDGIDELADFRPHLVQEACTGQVTPRAAELLSAYASESDDASLLIYQHGHSSQLAVHS